MSINFYFTVYSMLILIGLFGIIINRGNLVKLVCSLQIAIIGCLSIFIVFAENFNNIHGQIFTILYILIALIEIIIATLIIKRVYDYQQFRK